MLLNKLMSEALRMQCVQPDLLRYVAKACIACSIHLSADHVTSEQQHQQVVVGLFPLMTGLSALLRPGTAPSGMSSCSGSVSQPINR